VHSGGRCTLCGKGAVVSGSKGQRVSRSSTPRVRADASDDGPGADCPTHLRYNGATYTAFQRYRFTHEQPTRLGSATQVCAGTTINAGDPISVWSLPGGPPADVIGRRVYPTGLVVYVADSVKRPDRARVLAAVAATR
jgi:hypothetical protein